MTRIEQLLRERVGLDSATIGSSVIARGVRLRCEALGLGGPEAYLSLLHQSTDEWSELLELLLVNESWFFRDEEPFRALGRVVVNEWLPGHPTRPLLVLSAPCASGEEPYSIAMALLDAGVPAARFRVDAIDLSARALARAERGIFGKNAFRGQNLEFRDRYFQPLSGGYALHARVRGCVNFCLGNLLSPDGFAGRAAYDFVFCRNLLIYCHPAAQRKILSGIRSLLAPDGMVFVGAAEQPALMANQFAPAEFPMAFAFRNAGGGLRRRRPRAGARRLSAPVQSSASPPPFPREPAPPRSHPAPVVLQGADKLREAYVLADAGRLEKALALCQEVLRNQGPSADAYYLLGMIRQSSGDPAAAACFRKALYLQPNHYGSLVRLAGYFEQGGQPERANIYRRRAERARPDPHQL